MALTNPNYVPRPNFEPEPPQTEVMAGRTYGRTFAIRESDGEA